MSRSVYTDYSLDHGLRQRSGSAVVMSDDVTTYDNACNYSIHVVDRFEENHPDMAGRIRRMRWGVPAVHIYNHKEDCEYLFGTAYMEHVGHFHGETAEHYWPSANKVGAHVQHMNNGHRQDTLNDHHGDWNWKKVQKMSKHSSCLLSVHISNRAMTTHSLRLLQQRLSSTISSMRRISTLSREVILLGLLLSLGSGQKSGM